MILQKWELPDHVNIYLNVGAYRFKRVKIPRFNIDTKKNEEATEIKAKLHVGIKCFYELTNTY